jgi:hypothetical protein
MQGFRKFNLSTAAVSYLAKLCEDIGQLKDENGNSFLKNADGTMSEANAKQMVESIENALKNSGNSNLTAFNLPNKADAIQALMVGSCTAFSEEMAKGFTALMLFKQNIILIF